MNRFNVQDNPNAITFLGYFVGTILKWKDMLDMSGSFRKILCKIYEFFVHYIIDENNSIVLYRDAVFGNKQPGRRIQFL